MLAQHQLYDINTRIRSHYKKNCRLRNLSGHSFMQHALDSHSKRRTVLFFRFSIKKGEHNSVFSFGFMPLSLYGISRATHHLYMEYIV